MYPCHFNIQTGAAKVAAHSLSGAEFRHAVVGLERLMKDINGGGDGLDDFPLTHHFAPGVYGREMLIPAGGTIVGKVHRHAHLNIVVRGLAKVATEFGSREVRGGDVFVSQPGTKRAVHAIEDTVWITIHPNTSDAHDLDEIERYVIAAPTYDALPHEEKEALQ